MRFFVGFAEGIEMEPVPGLDQGEEPVHLMMDIMERRGLRWSVEFAVSAMEDIRQWWLPSVEVVVNLAKQQLSDESVSPEEFAAAAMDCFDEAGGSLSVDALVLRGAGNLGAAIQYSTINLAGAGLARCVEYVSRRIGDREMRYYLGLAVGHRLSPHSTEKSEKFSLDSVSDVLVALDWIEEYRHGDVMVQGPDGWHFKMMPWVVAADKRALVSQYFASPTLLRHLQRMMGDLLK